MNFLLSPSPYQFPSPFVSGRTGSLRRPRRAWPGSRRRSVQRPRQRQLCRTRWCRWLWARSRKLAQGTCMGVWGRVVLGCVMWYGVVLGYSVCVCVVAYCTVLCVSVPLMGSNLSFFDLTALKKFIGLPSSFLPPSLTSSPPARRRAEVSEVLERRLDLPLLQVFCRFHAFLDCVFTHFRSAHALRRQWVMYRNCRYGVMNDVLRYDVFCNCWCV